MGKSVIFLNKHLRIGLVLFFNKHLRIGLVLFFSLIGLSACLSQSATTIPFQNSHPIKIGASISLSGDFSADGKALQQGYQLWQDAVNRHGGVLGRPVQFDFVDDNSTQAEVATNYQKMITVHHDDLVVGPFSTSLTIAASTVAHYYNYAFIEGAGTAPKVFASGTHNLFSVSLSATHYLQSFVLFILSLPQNERPKTVAYASSDNFFTQPQIDTARALLEQGKVKTVLYNIYPEETTNYAPIAQKIINAHADAVILGTEGQQDCVAYMKIFKQQRYNPGAIVATAGPDQGKQFIDPLGGPQGVEGIFVPNGGWYPGVTNFQSSHFIQDYLAKYGGTTDDISADSVEAYSAGQVLEQAIAKSHSIDNARLIQELHSASFNTLQGPVQFADDGENTLAVAYLFQWQMGKLVVVYPNGAAQNNPEFPKHPW